MNRSLLVLSAVTLWGTISAGALARDVDMRPRSEADAASTSFPSTNTAAAATTTGNNATRLSTEERITRLEAIADSQILEMLSRIQTLEREIQLLRGEQESQAHQLQDINKKQRDLYIDIDRRLLNLEKLTQGQPGANTATPVPTTTNSAQIPTNKPVGDKTDGAAAAEDDQQAYQQAFDHLRDQRYEKAITEFRNYIKNFPKGRYAHVSQYWIAEAFFAQGQFKDAILAYQKLIDNYPNSPKLAEAMLKVAESYYKLNDMSNAQKTAERLLKVYPGTEEAKQGQALLQRIKSHPPAKSKNKQR